MFQPQYTITDLPLANIKRINCLITELNNNRFPNVELLELERSAREMSAHASTSREGNPLPLTEVKKILKTKPSHTRASEKEILNYHQALQDLNKQIEEGTVKLSLNLILKIQKQVILDLLPKLEKGHLREKPIVVNDPRTGQPISFPPGLNILLKGLLMNYYVYRNFFRKLPLALEVNCNHIISRCKSLLEKKDSLQIRIMQS
ncbi:MAG: hypothetical protein ACR2LN_06750 [Candidatus Levyibacteriota bacterium]